MNITYYCPQCWEDVEIRHLPHHTQTAPLDGDTLHRFHTEPWDAP